MILTLNMGAAMAGGSDVTLWTFKTDEKIYATPLIHEGIVYIGSLDGNFYALNAATGAELWRFTAENKIFTTAAIYQNIVCFASGNNFYGLDLAGALQWKTPLYNGTVVNQHDEWDYFQSSPRVVDGIAYLGTEKGLVYGINMLTGAIVFQCQTPGKFTIETKPAVDNNMIYFGDWDGVLYAYNLLTAEKVWNYDTKKDNTYSWVNAIQTDPVVYNNSIFFGGRSCNIYSLDPLTGAKKWSFHDGGNMWLLGGPTIADDKLYMGSSNQHFIQAFNVASGVKIWTKNVDYRIFGTPLVDGDFLFFGTGNEFTEKLGSLFAIDKSSGEIRNRIPVPGQVHSSPVIMNGVVYFGCGDGNVYAIDKQKMLDKPFSKTDFKSSKVSDLGKIPHDIELFHGALYLYNTGPGTDVLTISASASSIPDGSVVVEPSSCQIAAGDSAAIQISIVPGLLDEKKYTLVLSLISENNIEKWSINKTIRFQIVAATGVQKNNNNQPSGFTLEQNFPNPFNPDTMIRYTLPSNGQVRLAIHDILGREIKTIVSEYQHAGTYCRSWNGQSETAENVASGIYIVSLRLQEAGVSQFSTRRITLVR
jgi:eukaryotic-like serine/threonine-protein kinase